MQELLKTYLSEFEEIKINQARVISPHKPILLLSILESVRSKAITSNRIYITPELVALFKSLWNDLVTDGKSDCRFSLPFFHLKTSEFWKLVAKPGFENAVKFSKSIRSFSELNLAIDYAQIDSALFELMKDEHSNLVLKQFLLDKYFSDSKKYYPSNNSGQQKIFSEIEGKILNESAEEYRSEIKKLLEEKNDEEIFIRGGVFKREIPRIYKYACCISGMSISAGDVSMIDACHIIPFSESYNDTITNGISLCPNLHRAFDRGLISIDDNYKVLVKSTWSEEQSSYSIKQFEGKQILLSSNPNQFPSKENFQSHRSRWRF